MRCHQRLVTMLALARALQRGLPRVHARRRVISMGLKTGIVGLPNVGKSTLFNALTGDVNAEAANYPFCTIEPNVGVVSVPDERLNKLSEINASEKTVPTSLEFVDIAGLVKGASKGEGLGNQSRAVRKLTSASGAPDNSSLSHFSAMTRPSWLGRAARDRHRHAIEQASRRWRERAVKF